MKKATIRKYGSGFIVEGVGDNFGEDSVFLYSRALARALAFATAYYDELDDVDDILLHRIHAPTTFEDKQLVRYPNESLRPQVSDPKDMPSAFEVIRDTFFNKKENQRHD